MEEHAALKDLAAEIRRRSLLMTHQARSSHIASSLSMADLLAVLYGSFLHVDPEQPTSPGRDRFILSKGHAAAGLYAALAISGFIEPEELDMFCADGGRLIAHVSHHVPGVEVSTGSLGHGLPIGVGMALALQADGELSRVVVLMGDGELDEGSVWEAALVASARSLESLIVIVDYNKLQAFGRIEEVTPLEPLADKWRAFGWDVVEIDGHDIAQIDAALSACPLRPGRPSVLLAHTVKGKGVSFMEDDLQWHYRSVDESGLRSALEEIDAS